LERIENLVSTPRPVGSLKLKGEDDLWRIRIGDYRVVYGSDDLKRNVDVTVIRHRKDVYRDS
jgi:mRNA interferase RelE/StbE